MKNLFEDKDFAEYWDQFAGAQGDDYKRFVIDPLMFELAAPLSGRDLVELGCGNGYLGGRFLLEGARTAILTDYSQANLDLAKQKFDDPRISYARLDVLQKWDLPDNSVDVLYSNFMLNEIDELKFPFQEAFRVLRPNGTFVFSVTHPSWDLYEFAREKAGQESRIIEGLGNYFQRRFTKFIIGDSSQKTTLVEKFGKRFELQHYQRPLSDYVNDLIDAGFRIEKLLEPELAQELLKHNPGYADFQDHPVGLIVKARRE
jgi:ubiquinone/menaquinone biosynthesis C-methylase UbiE